MRHKNTVYSPAFHEQHEQMREEVEKAKKNEEKRQEKDKKEGQSAYRKKLATKKK